ncbi:TetR/AcrR family transcriptional regulator [Psychrobacillus glaciei]|uniref:TetR/AcrR family transcriptional regulator n=1 Tax=Psychrobacillus glaciei TaxID=2283160 RepID=A0A5J6SR73_9BACI|nr:TetR/AcrR family transcriptional regulator [Psychrobacillus glaciei]QFG00476.1 TetR/AcrR family transcriptional regulator [Psychrobacillus glaciei]
MSSIDIRIVKTKEALHQSLLEILKEKALETISVSEICRRARVNRGTFYLHYAQVEDLFEEYFKEIMEDLAISYEEPYRHVSILKSSSLNPATIRIFHHIEKYKPFYKIVFSKNAPLTYYYLLFEEINELLNKDKGMKSEEEFDMNVYCAYQANAILGIIIQWYKEDFQQSADYLNQQLVKILNVKIDRD